MKKQVLLLIAFCFSLQMLQAQTLDFQFNITNPSSDSTCDGQINLTYTGSQEPLNVIWYNEYLQPIGTSNSVSGLCIGSNSVSLEDSHCKAFWFSTDLNDSSISGSTFQLNLSINKENNTEISSLEIQQYTGLVVYNTLISAIMDMIPQPRYTVIQPILFQILQLTV